jgi:hypothetical protein
MTFLIIVHSRMRKQRVREPPILMIGKTMNLICVCVFMIRHLSFHVNGTIEKTFSNEIVLKGGKNDEK